MNEGINNGVSSLYAFLRPHVCCRSPAASAFRYARVYYDNIIVVSGRKPRVRQQFTTTPRSGANYFFDCTAIRKQGNKDERRTVF